MQLTLPLFLDNELLRSRFPEIVKFLITEIQFFCHHCFAHPILGACRLFRFIPGAIAFGCWLHDLTYPGDSE